MAHTAAAANISALSKPSSSFPKPLLPKLPTLSFPPKKPYLLHISSSSTSTTITTSDTPASIPRFGPSEQCKAANILVEVLELAGVTDVFASPGGATLEIHQDLTRSNYITNNLLRQEQGEAFAAEGYARGTDKPGICIATSSPGATNLVSALADALLDSVPLITITGQVPRRMIGTDAFQETPIVEVTGSITKLNYLVLDVEDIPRVVKEAFFLTTTGRPGPVLVDKPMDIQQQLSVPMWDPPMMLLGYLSRLPKALMRNLIEQIVRLISESKRPVLYVGGGCSAYGDELKRFVELTGIPVANTLMGLGCYPTDDELSLKMLGMHGTVYANYAVDKSDLLRLSGLDLMIE